LKFGLIRCAAAALCQRVDESAGTNRAQKNALITGRLSKNAEAFPVMRTAMSAIAHHTDIDSPPLANLLALSQVY
jgi:hypothetical protein